MESTHEQDRVNAVAAAASVAAAAAAVNANANIMKELSDIKVSQGKNDTEIKNIGLSVMEIKQDVKEIKSLYVTHAELSVFQKSVEEIDRDHERRLRSHDTMIKYGVGALYIINIIIGWYLIIKFR